MIAFTLVGKAQYFVEGSVGFDNSENKIDGDVLGETSNLGISLSPEAGYWLNDNIALGTRLTLAQVNNKSFRMDMVPSESKQETDYKVSRWRFSAFGRYKLWSIENFSLLVDGSIFYEEKYEKSMHKTSNYYGESSIFDFKIGFDLLPAITYDLNEKLSIKIVCSFLSMEAFHENGNEKSTSEHYTDGGFSRISTSKSKANRIVFNSQGSLGSIRIGIIYNF